MTNKKPKNHGKRWTSVDQSKIEGIADQIENREQLERISFENAPEFERTSVAVAKRIELYKGWHYRQKNNK
ncbi:hypothetical protein EHS13_23025 [Paenibacillus psychroresistens]|uniref:Uncharacterized protein n=1 Tax=Paenibacillus psychroresistens TaxID=1778678 RepID=A0A6B8RPU3_9BACL|nr:hypothetical protein [Paenibacillus psychroresistens]QGQ97555.1 hypothetical protein EHS13_23025 [Paenibacillus psychroresistens]